MYISCMLTVFPDRKECMEKIGDHWFTDCVTVYTAEDQGPE